MSSASPSTANASSGRDTSAVTTAKAGVSNNTAFFHPTATGAPSSDGNSTGGGGGDGDGNGNSSLASAVVVGMVMGVFILGALIALGLRLYHRKRTMHQEGLEAAAEEVARDHGMDVPTQHPSPARGLTLDTAGAMHRRRVSTAHAGGPPPSSSADAADTDASASAVSSAVSPLRRPINWARFSSAAISAHHADAWRTRREWQGHRANVEDDARVRG